MMRITDVRLIPSQVSGNEGAIGILMGQRPFYEYKDGQKTEKQLGITYDVVFPDNKYEKISVKVAGTQAVVSEEEIKKNSGKIKVRFLNLTGRFYRANSGEYMLTCRADKLEVIS